MGTVKTLGCLVTFSWAAALAESWPTGGGFAAAGFLGMAGFRAAEADTDGLESGAGFAAILEIFPPAKGFEVLGGGESVVGGSDVEVEARVSSLEAASVVTPSSTPARALTVRDLCKSFAEVALLPKLLGLLYRSSNPPLAPQQLTFDGLLTCNTPPEHDAQDGTLSHEKKAASSPIAYRKGLSCTEMHHNI